MKKVEPRWASAATLLASFDELDELPRMALIILHAALGMIALVAAAIRGGGSGADRYLDRAKDRLGEGP